MVLCLAFYLVEFFSDSIIFYLASIAKQGCAITRRSYRMGALVFCLMASLMLAVRISGKHISASKRSLLVPTLDKKHMLC